MKIKYLFSLFVGSALMFTGCESVLDEDVYSELDPATLFTSANGIERVLFGAYREAQVNDNFGGNIWFQEEWTCDQFWETGGAVNLQAVVMLAFTWDASYPDHWSGLWRNFYESIRNCNLVLENIDQSPVEGAIKEKLIAEARFVRASAYYGLYTRWGGVPLRLKTTGEQELARATDQEIKEFIIKEFTEVAPILPNQGEIAYGRATKGAALGYLCKIYLNAQEWQKCADVAKQIMDMNFYKLWADYYTLFSVGAKMQQKEYLWVYTCSALGPGNEFINGAFPPEFAKTTDGSIVFTSNMRNWARMDRVLDSFYNSFDPDDKRKDLIITEYVNAKGEAVSLLNNDNTRSFKFLPDPNSIGNAHGNDIPVIRYADILLARAEALNELNGPNQESLDLIQMVRDRAGLTTPLKLSDYTKETLRSRILDERSWEFYGENLRRQDLLRHGLFIQKAKERGIKIADEHHKLFPIPQKEIDANSLCEQTQGY